MKYCMAGELALDFNVDVKIPVNPIAYITT